MKYSLLTLLIFCCGQLVAQNAPVDSLISDSVTVAAADTTEPGIDTLVSTSAIQALVNQGIDTYTAFVDGGSTDEAQVEAAIGHFKAALEQDAGHFEANENIGRVYANESNRLMMKFNEERADMSPAAQKEIERKIFEYMTLAEEHAAKAKK